MKLALLQSFLPSRSQGGVGHFTHQLANRLAARGHNVTVFSLDAAPGDASYSVVRAPASLPYLTGRLGHCYGFGIWLARQDFARFDVVHAMGDNHFLRTRAPVVRTLSGCALAEAWHASKLTTRLMQLSLYPLELLGAARADAAVGISRNSNAFFPGVDQVIPQGIDRHIFKPGGEKSQTPSVLFVGHRFRDRKRAYLLVDAFQQVIRPAVATAQLWLVCDDVVTLPGVQQFANLPIEALAELYRRAWVFCLPSSYEGFGRPYAEAMAAGTPVVATPNAGAIEVLDNGRYGIIAEPATLGETIVGLLSDPPRREGLAAAGLSRAQEFDWERVVDAYERLYAATLQKKVGSPRQRSPLRASLAHRTGDES
jgi:glycosyltransferase involved in cell wall biosynthesis